MSGWLARLRRMASHMNAWSSTSSTMTWYSGVGNSRVSSPGGTGAGSDARILFGKMLQDGDNAGANLIDRKYFRGGLYLDGGFWHSIYGASPAVLHNRMMPGIVDEFEPVGAVPAHAGQQHADNVAAPIVSD